MPQFLVAIHLPADHVPASEDAATMAAIDALNRDMVTAGIRVFVGGLQPVRTAATIRPGSAGEPIVTDGPFAEAKEHVGGFWVLDLPDRDSALAWGKRAAEACQAPVEVRGFN